MWFGNLVTMKWWDDIWLNEGFARYCEHQILETLRPEYRCWTKYLYQVYKVAIDADSVALNTHPVRLAVPSPDELEDIFDTISYSKGSVVCRMGADFGGHKFFVAVRQYMKIFAY
jgi:aminopeptidase N